MTEEGRDDIVNLNALCIVVQLTSAIMGVLKGWGCCSFRNSGHMTTLRQPSKRNCYSSAKQAIFRDRALLKRAWCSFTTFKRHGKRRRNFSIVLTPATSKRSQWRQVSQQDSYMVVKLSVNTGSFSSSAPGWAACSVGCHPGSLPQRHYSKRQRREC